MRRHQNRAVSVLGVKNGYLMPLIKVLAHFPTLANTCSIFSKIYIECFSNKKFKYH